MFKLLRLRMFYVKTEVEMTLLSSYFNFKIEETYQLSVVCAIMVLFPCLFALHNLFVFLFASSVFQ